MKRRMVKLLGVIGTIAMLFSMPSNVMARDSFSITYSQENNGIETRSEVYEWMLKYENGKVYKRLYNVTRGYYVGDWIQIG